LYILKAYDKFDEVSEVEKNLVRTIELNEIAYSELSSPLMLRPVIGTIAFNIVKEFKYKVYPDGNAANV
jgi:hypothetical protein